MASMEIQNFNISIPIPLLFIDHAAPEQMHLAICNSICLPVIFYSLVRSNHLTSEAVFR